MHTSWLLSFRPRSLPVSISRFEKGRGPAVGGTVRAASFASSGALKDRSWPGRIECPRTSSIALGLSMKGLHLAAGRAGGTTATRAPWPAALVHSTAGRIRQLARRLEPYLPAASPSPFAHTCRVMHASMHACRPPCMQSCMPAGGGTARVPSFHLLEQVALRPACLQTGQVSIHFKLQHDRQAAASKLQT